MCRLFAVRASHAIPVARPLVSAANALVCQSRADFQGQAHPDGWGLGWYVDGEPRVVKSITAAGDDPDFAPAARAIHSSLVLAHVRQASVGTLTLENTHPFRWGRWLFAHNGTVARFGEVAERLTAELPADFRAARRGATDSELVFLCLLGRLRAAGHRLDASPTAGAAAESISVEALMAAVGGITHDLVAWTPVEPDQKPTALNLLITDGEVLVASRWKRSLWWCRLDRPPAWSERGAAEPAQAGEPYWAMAVGSEPSTDDAWSELPDGAIVGVDAQGQVRQASPV